MWAKANEGTTQCWVTNNNSTIENESPEKRKETNKKVSSQGMDILFFLAKSAFESKKQNKPDADTNPKIPGGNSTNNKEVVRKKWKKRRK